MLKENIHWRNKLSFNMIEKYNAETSYLNGLLKNYEDKIILFKNHGLDLEQSENTKILQEIKNKIIICARKRLQTILKLAETLGLNEQIAVLELAEKQFENIKHIIGEK